MALIGGGGAGNVAGGANPSGTGTSLNYIGNHAYANSGVIQTETSAAPHLNFTTGGEYIVGELELQGACNLAEILYCLNTPSSIALCST